MVEVSKAKVGKHGAAKCHFVGIDLFTDRKYEAICPASAQLSEPICTLINYTLCDISDDDYLSLMSKENVMRDDLKIPTEEVLAKKLRTRLEEGRETLCVILAAMGEEHCIDLKEVAQGN